MYQGFFTTVIIQKRGYCGNPVDYFAKNWSEYQVGFKSNCELWLGLDKIYEITSQARYSLKVELTDWSSNVYVAYYRSFAIGDESDNYRLAVSGYDELRSNLSDALSPDEYESNGQPFSTKDKAVSYTHLTLPTNREV